MVPRILVVAQPPADWLEPLRTAGLDVDISPGLGGDHDALCAAAAGAEAIVCALTTPIDAGVLSRGARSGCVDVSSARHHHVAVCNTPGVLNSATADVAMLLILAACRGATGAQASLVTGSGTASS